jgi:hypothetical protein
MRASMLSSFKEFLAGDSVVPLVLNADSEATFDITKTANYNEAMK